jgi:hypothetical protein
MWWIAAAQVAASVWQGVKAKSAARKQASGDAQAYWNNATEELRRLKTAQDLNASNIKTGMAISNLLNEGSAQRFSDVVGYEQERQFNWQKDTAELNRANILRGGKQQGSALYSSALIQGASAALGTWQAYNARKGD